MAGVEIEDGEPVFNDPPELEDEGGSSGDDEAPFDPDGYIEGYSELSVVSKMKSIKALDPDDDEEAALMEDIADWENAQEKPSSRVLNYIDETLGPEEGAEPEGDDEAEAEEAEEAGEPWEGYDKATAAQIKQVLTDAKDDDDEPLTAEQVEYVLDYERNREKPPPRKRVIDFCEALLEEFANGGEEPEEEPEERPKRGRGRGRGRSRKAEQSEPKPASPPSENGVITLTREQILTALDSGEVLIEI
jgi:hypothetical protein